MLRSVRGQKEAGMEEGGEAGLKMVNKKKGGQREAGNREAGNREIGKGNKATGDRIGKGGREGLRKTGITSK